MLDGLLSLTCPVQALLATLFTWSVTALGAGVVFFLRKPNQNLMDAMLGMAGGVMVAAAFFSLLAPSVEMAEVLGLIPWLTAMPSGRFWSPMPRARSQAPMRELPSGP